MKSDHQVRNDHPNRIDHQPTASLEMLQRRAVLLSAVREFFQARGYWEVETPLLSHDIVVDAFLEPFATRWLPEPAAAFRSGAAAEGSPRELFLQTSPEFGMKRLLSAGATAIYQVTRAFRNGEVGRYHNPEFTMVEWYRVGDTHHDQMTIVEELVEAVFQRTSETGSEQAAAAPAAPPQGIACPYKRPFLRLTYDEAFERYAGRRVLGLTAAELADLARGRQIVPPPGLAADDRDGWLNWLLAELVEPPLAQEGAVFLYDYPATQAALARARDDDPPVAERFELYLDGIEICNGYRELTDADELRARIEQQASIRAKEGLRPLPKQNRLLEAMAAGLPECAGVALGFDRLAMLALGASSLAEVIAFPFERA